MSDLERKKVQSMNDSVEDEDASGSEIEAEMELIYEDEGLRKEYEDARQWLDSLSPQELLKPALFDPKHIKELQTAYKSNKPYPHLVIEDFMDKELLDKITEEIKTLEWKPKNNDLYLFHQSTLDLKASRSPLIKKLCEVLYSEEFVSILKEITGLPLFTVKSTMKPQQNTPQSDGVATVNQEPQHPDFQHSDYTEPDMFSAVYGDTCRLLCHDDELEGRRIAYIIYLTPEWKHEWGGHLDLFNHEQVPSKHDFSYLPTTIERSIVPHYAQFAFFEVSETSFHQVREVHRTGATEEEQQRLSISGWYHGPRIVREHDEYIPSLPPQLPAQSSTMMKPFVVPPFNQSRMTQDEIKTKQAQILAQLVESKNIVQYGEKKQPETKVQIEDNIKFWINKTYLQKSTQKQVQQRFEDESSIDLVNFLKPSVYAQLLAECFQLESKLFKPVNPQDPSEPSCTIRPIQPDAADCSGAPIEFVGPCNQRAYYRYSPQYVLEYITTHPQEFTHLQKDQTSLVYQYLQFLHSKSFFTLIQLLTGMKLESTYHELQLFRPGCYTLAHDNDPEIQTEGLDIIYSLYSSNKLMKTLPLPANTVSAIDQEWDQDDFGGSIHYLVAGEEEELLSVISPSNTLSLVFRSGEERILQFQRYIDHRAPGSLYRFKGLARCLD